MENLAHGRTMLACKKLLRFLKRSPNEEKNGNDQTTHQQGNSPSPRGHLLRREPGGKDHSQNRSEHHCALLARRLPTDVEPFVSGRSDFGKVNRHASKLDAR